jgi:hypothetical protein
MKVPAKEMVRPAIRIRTRCLLTKAIQVPAKLHAKLAVVAMAEVKAVHALATEILANGITEHLIAWKRARRARP